MRIAITGSTGLIGTGLTRSLRDAGQEVVRLVRRVADEDDEVRWDPSGGTIDASGLEGTEAVVHLAGENVGAGRWTAGRKDRILTSRVAGTDLLARTLAGLTSPPEVLVCASAIGFYGDRGEERLDESSAKGEGFLADVCARWEAAAQPARDAGIRTVHLRFGVVLSPAGGALQRMLLPFKLGLGGRLGSGRQGMSWIALPDAVGAIRHALAEEDLAGPVNAVAPETVSNLTFTKTLGTVLRRPTIFPVPAFALRLLLGEMADEMLLASAHVEPAKLKESGYAFRHPRLEGALRSLLGAAPPADGAPSPSAPPAAKEKVGV